VIARAPTVEPPIAGRPADGSPRTGRDGTLRLAFERRGEATVLAACRSTLPLQVLAPVALEGPAAVVALLNPTGGVFGGDRLAVDVAIGAGAHACLTTPSATRIYRTCDAPAVQSVRLALARGAVAEWVPAHTIPSADAAVRQTMDVEVAAGATLFAVDAWAAGRVARGEAWRFRRLDAALTVRDDAGLLLHDRFVLDGGTDWTALGFAEGRPYFATIAVVADAGLDALLAELAAATPIAGACLAAARLPRRAALVRCLAGSAPALTSALTAVWALARRRLLGLPPLDLRTG
jgi:urease accessory protein